MASANAWVRQESGFKFLSGKRELSAETSSLLAIYKLIVNSSQIVRNVYNVFFVL
jgi:hypothetical protein